MDKPKLALDAPQDDLVVLTRSRVGEAIRESRASARGRIIAPLHRSLSDDLHRMFNAMQPGTYVHPHRHLSPPKAEAWILLHGEVLFLMFDEEGAVLAHPLLSASGEHFGVDLVPGYYHSLIALQPDTVIYEVKSGPYEKHTDKAFAPWAPAEGTPESLAYMEALRKKYVP